MSVKKAFLWNLVLALIWTAASGKFTLATLLTGLLIGFIVLLVTHRFLESPGYWRKVVQIVEFIGFVLLELIISNLRMARSTLTPKMFIRPAVIGIHLELRDEAAIALLAGVITLTPGTLAIDVSADRSVLFVHTMFGEFRDRFELTIKQKYERRILELWR